MAEFTMKERDMDGDDEVLMRVRATLAPLPVVDAQAVARMLTAVHARRQEPRTLLARIRALPASLLATLRLAPVSMIGGSTIVIAAVVSMIVVRGASPRRDAAATSVAAGSGATASAPASRAGAGAGAAAVSPGVGVSGGLSPTFVGSGAERDPEAMQPVQFVLDAPGAGSVAVVGDFNDWNLTASPMQRLPGAGIWTITVPVAPGRHVYSFVIDGTRWIADPRAPRAVDSDFGKPGSVLMVDAR